MKIAWIQDVSRPHGGAENSNRTVVAAGEALGHDVVGITPTNFNPWVLEQADVLIVNNFWEFPPVLYQAALDALWKGKKPYVVYSHDHRDLQRRPEFARELFGRSVLNVFISPRHLGNYRKGIGCEGIALPLAIDVELFRPVPGIEREEDLALVSAAWVRGGKVSKELLSFMREERRFRYLSVGSTIDGAKVIPNRPLEEMPKVYSRVSAVVHFPNVECAGERIVFEAALCDVKEFHLGERAGHASWGFDLTDRHRLAQILSVAPIKFWEEVERAAS